VHGWLAMRRLERPPPMVERSARLGDHGGMREADHVAPQPRHRSVPARESTVAAIPTHDGAAVLARDRAAVPVRDRGAGALPTGDDAAKNGPSVVPEPAHPGGAPPMIRYADDALSLHVVNMPLRDVLQAIARQAGVAVRGGAGETREVNVGFENVPFVQALRRLLGVRNFVVTYDGGHPRVLEVLEPTGAPAADTTVQTAAEAAPSAAQSIAALLDARPPVPLSTNLVQALGARAMSLRQLLDLAVNNTDKGVRGIAMGAAVEALQTDPELRAAMFGSRPGLRDGIFGALVQGMERERAQEALFYVAMQARDSELRNGAATLIQRIATFGTSGADG
jgi:hypothetical protein